MEYYLFQVGQDLNIKSEDYLIQVKDFGVSRLIFTDINRDGTKLGPNFEQIKKLLS